MNFDRTFRYCKPKTPIIFKQVRTSFPEMTPRLDQPDFAEWVAAVGVATTAAGAVINKINGILLPGQCENIEVKLAQYADDTTLLINSNADVSAAMAVLEDFKSFSWLHLNM